MKIIVGLGNPGFKYRKTRHNAGFMAADILAKKSKTRFKTNKDLAAKIAMTVIGDETAVIIKPQTYMNHSGYAVSAVMDYYEADISDIIVIYDDVDLPVGNLRIRKKGSGGTHNGMRNILEYLESDKFTRIRIGIGKTPPYKTIVDHVLGKFLKEEKDDIEKGVKNAADAAAMIIKEGADKAQSVYNG